MAKLIMILALAFTALVAFATAHTTIVTTTIEDENPIFQKEEPCRQHLGGQQFDQCLRYLQQGQIDIPFQEDFPQSQQCCQELQNVDEQCQCKALKQVFREAQQQMQHQQGQQQQFPFSGPEQMTQQLRLKAQALPYLCKLRSRQCSLGKITTEAITIPPMSRSSRQCSQTDIQRPVNKCQRYVAQQINSSPRTLLMSFQRPEQQQELQQCCNELQNVKQECQCPAITEVARRVMKQQPQQQGGFFGGEKKEIMRRVLQNLPNECDLEVQQCSIPFP